MTYGWGVAPPPRAGWFVAEADYDGFVTLHGPYWEAEKAAEKQRAVEAVEHFQNFPGRVTLIPVEGIRPI